MRKMFVYFSTVLVVNHVNGVVVVINGINVIVSLQSKNCQWRIAREEIVKVSVESERGAREERELENVGCEEEEEGQTESE